MNKKGFTLVEILAVIVILSLIITIVATNGFGAFNNTKGKITEIEIEQVQDAIELLAVEIENCDDDLDKELYKSLNYTSCENLKDDIGSSNITISLDYLYNYEYLNKKELKGYDKTKEFYFWKSNDKIYTNLEDVYNNETETNEEDNETDNKNQTIMKYYGNNSTSDFYKYKNQIVEISFVKHTKIIDEVEKWKISSADSKNEIWAWITGSENNYKLFIGSKDTIYANARSSYMFNGFKNLKKISFKNFNTSKVTTMYQMFYNCTSLISLDLSSFDTSKVTTMYQMFYNCTSLKTLNLSRFDTNIVTTMYQMFYNCSSLISLDLSNFKTSNVTTMYQMFYNCSSLETLNLKGFNTSNIKDMSRLFYNCSSLKNLDISTFDTSNVTTMLHMFSGCSSLTSLNLNHFKTSKVVRMNFMFKGCSSLETIYLDKFDTSSLQYMNCMFEGCSSLESIDLRHFNTSNVTSISNLFSGCKSLKIIDISGFDLTKTEGYFEAMFSDCTSLTTLRMNNVTMNITTDNYTYIYDMFKNCSSLTTLDLSALNLDGLSSSLFGTTYAITNAFSGCNNLKTIYVNSNVTKNTLSPASARQISGLPTTTSIIVK